MDTKANYYALLLAIITPATVNQAIKLMGLKATSECRILAHTSIPKKPKH